MIGFAGPAFMFVGFAAGIVAGGVVLALLSARTPKLGALMLVGAVNGVIFTLTGHFFWTFIVLVFLGLVADLILWKSSHPARVFPLAYGVFSMWCAAPFIPLVINSEAYFDDISAQMGQEYASAMAEIFRPWVVGVIAVVALLVGILAGRLGVKVGRKHFESAGLL